MTNQRNIAILLITEMKGGTAGQLKSRKARAGSAVKRAGDASELAKVGKALASEQRVLILQLLSRAFTILIASMSAVALAFHVIAAERTPIYVVVTDNNGEIVTEGEDSFGDGWGVLSCISPDGDYIDLAPGSWQLALKPSGTTNCNPTPVEPVGDFFGVTFADGSAAVLRLPTGSARDIARAEARYKDRTYHFNPITEVEAARIQLEGLPWPELSNKPPVDILVSRADCTSLIAYTDGEGQKEALVFAAEAVTGLLEAYRNVHGEYPEVLCELCTGDKRVIRAGPRNPYDYGKTVAKSVVSFPRPKGHVRYYPQEVGERDARKVVGYWLAVIADGEELNPSTPLPPGFEVPFRAIRWFESHPAPVEEVLP